MKQLEKVITQPFPLTLALTLTLTLTPRKCQYHETILEGDVYIVIVMLCTNNTHLLVLPYSSLPSFPFRC